MSIRLGSMLFVLSMIQSLLVRYRIKKIGIQQLSAGVSNIPVNVNGMADDDKNTIDKLDHKSRLLGLHKMKHHMYVTMTDNSF